MQDAIGLCRGAIIKTMENDKEKSANYLTAADRAQRRRKNELFAILEPMYTYRWRT